jgi:hypothetical protein
MRRPADTRCVVSGPSTRDISRLNAVRGFLHNRRRYMCHKACLMRQPRWGCITVMYAGAAMSCCDAMSNVALSVYTCTVYVRTWLLR